MSFPLIIEAEKFGKVLEFNSIDEIQNWYATEQSQLAWIEHIRKPITKIAWSSIVSVFTELTSIITLTKQNIRSGIPIQENLKAIEAWFEKVAKNRSLILSHHPEMELVNKLKIQNEYSAAVAYGYLLNTQNLFAQGIDSPAALAGVVEAQFFKKAISKESLLVQKAALENLQTEWQKELDKQVVEYAKFQAELKLSKDNFENFYIDSRDKFTALIETQNSKFANLMTNAEAQIKALIDTYDQHMSLQKPVEYWTKKRGHHIEKIPKFRDFALGVGVLGGGLFVLISWIMLSGVSESKDYWKIGIVIALGTLFFWLLRMLVKLLVSHIHLERDAHEREVMAMTYLALTREQAGLKDEDKKLILNVLFRPANAGLIDEEAIPPGMYDLLSRFAGK